MSFWRDLFGSPKDFGSDNAIDGDPLDGFTRDEISNAALDILWRNGDRVSSDPSWIGGTVEKCEAALRRVAELRIKYADYQPKRMRREIEHWLDYYEHEAQEDLEDCRTKKSRRELDAYSRESDAKQDRVRQIHERLRDQRK